MSIRMRPILNGLISSLVSLLLLCDNVRAQECNTAQNPTCAGVAVFQALCCPWPSVCYWKDRYGTAACCPSGQQCIGVGGPSNPSVITYPYVIITNTYTYVTSTLPQHTETTQQEQTTTQQPADTPTTTITTTVSGLIAILNDASHSQSTLALIGFELLAFVLAYF